MIKNKVYKCSLLQPFSSTIKNVFFAVILLLISQTIVSLLSVPNLQNTLRIQTMVNPDAVRQFVQSWSAEEWVGFWRHYRWDFIHPLIYCYSLMVLNAHCNLEKIRFSRCNIIIIAAGFFDYSENISHILGLRNLDQICTGCIMAGGFFALAKWFAILFALYFLLTGLQKK